DDVPERDLNAADRGHDGRAALILVADHPANHAFDIERVTAEHARFHPLVREGLDGLLLPLESCLAHSREARVGPQADEEVVAQTGIGHQRFKPRDLQPTLPSSAAPAGFSALDLAGCPNSPYFSSWQRLATHRSKRGHTP